MPVSIQGDTPEDIHKLLRTNELAEAKYRAEAMLFMLNVQRAYLNLPPVSTIEAAMAQTTQRPSLPPQPTYFLPSAQSTTWTPPVQEWHPQPITSPPQAVEVYPQQPTVIEQPETILANAMPTKGRWPSLWWILYLLPPIIAAWFISGHLKLNLAANMMQPPGQQPEVQEQTAPPAEPPADQRNLIELLQPAIPQ